MSQLRLNDVTAEATPRSPLADCLLKLEQAGTPSFIEPEAVEPSFDWHTQWAANQDQISRRLKLIEVEMNRMRVLDIGPHLSLYPEDVRG